MASMVVKDVQEAGVSRFRKYANIPTSCAYLILVVLKGHQLGTPMRKHEVEKNMLASYEFLMLKVLYILSRCSLQMICQKISCICDICTGLERLA